MLIFTHGVYVLKLSISWNFGLHQDKILGDLIISSHKQIKCKRFALVIRSHQMYHIEQNSGKELHMFFHNRRQELSKD